MKCQLVYNSKLERIWWAKCVLSSITQDEFKLISNLFFSDSIPKLYNFAKKAVDYIENHWKLKLMDEPIEELDMEKEGINAQKQENEGYYNKGLYSENITNRSSYRKINESESKALSLFIF